MQPLQPNPEELQHVTDKGSPAHLAKRGCEAVCTASQVQL